MNDEHIGRKFRCRKCLQVTKMLGVPIQARKVDEVENLAAAVFSQTDEAPAVQLKVQSEVEFMDGMSAEAAALTTTTKPKGVPSKSMAVHVIWHSAILVVMLGLFIYVMVQFREPVRQQASVQPFQTAPVQPWISPEQQKLKDAQATFPSFAKRFHASLREDFKKSSDPVFIGNAGVGNGPKSPFFASVTGRLFDEYTTFVDESKDQRFTAVGQLDFTVAVTRNIPGLDLPDTIKLFSIRFGLENGHWKATGWKERYGDHWLTP